MPIDVQCVARFIVWLATVEPCRHRRPAYSIAGQANVSSIATNVAGDDEQAEESSNFTYTKHNCNTNCCFDNRNRRCPIYNLAAQTLLRRNLERTQPRLPLTVAHVHGLRDSMLQPESATLHRYQPALSGKQNSPRTDTFRHRPSLR